MKYGLIGEKLGHSFSKDIHELIGLYEYELKEIPKDEIDSFMTQKDFLGLNVTIPYKQTVIPYLDEIDEGAKAIGAVNTVVNKGGKLFGFNTDYYGLKTLIEDAGVNLKGSKVLILGTGGTSKTAKVVATDLGASIIYKVSRSGNDGAITYEEVYKDHTDADFIINTTPAGMYPNIDSQAIDLANFKNLKAVFDAIYNPLRTKLVLQAEELNIPAFCGLKMLVYQAVFAAGHFAGASIPKEQSEEIYKTIRNRFENIVLIGMPGVGKSTVGKRLAKELGMTFVDTDTLIVEKEKREISEIFATDGEKYFRDVESEVVRECASMKNAVIATGGGAILRQENVDVLKAFGRLFFLDRNPELIRPTDNRPLANEAEKIMKLYNERLPKYIKAADKRVYSEKGVGAAVRVISRYRNEH